MYDGNGDWEWRRQFVSGVFHDLAQPLTSLHCLLELSLRAKPDVEQQQSSLQDALKLTVDLMANIKRLRQLCEADDPGHPASVRLAWLVDDIIEEMSPVAKTYGARIHSSVGPLYARADPSRLRQAVFHLVDDALQSARGGTVLIEAKMKNGQVVLTIAPSRCRAALSEAEYNTTSHAVALANRIISAAKGSLSQDRVGAGTRFYVHLPVAETGDAS